MASMSSSSTENDAADLNRPVIPDCTISNAS